MSYEYRNKFSTRLIKVNIYSLEFCFPQWNIFSIWFAARKVETYKHAMLFPWTQFEDIGGVYLTLRVDTDCSWTWWRIQRIVNTWSGTEFSKKTQLWFWLFPKHVLHRYGCLWWLGNSSMCGLFWIIWVDLENTNRIRYMQTSSDFDKASYFFHNGPVNY